MNVLSSNSTNTMTGGSVKLTMPPVLPIINGTTATVKYWRSDANEDDQFALDVTDMVPGQEIIFYEAALQSLANSIATQNAVIAALAGEIISATASGASGLHEVDLQIVTGASHKDSMRIVYIDRATNDSQNLPADVTWSADQVRAAIQELAQNRVESIQSAADATSYNITVTGTPQI